LTEETVKARLVKAIYVLGTIFSILLLVRSIPSLLASLEEWSGSATYISWSPQRELFLYIAAAAASYGVGWGIRWIVTGETKSVIGRLKK